MMEPKLKPCPFCGGKGVEFGSPRELRVGVACRECGGQWSVYYVKRDGEYDVARAAVLALWNRRAGSEYESVIREALMEIRQTLTDQNYPVNTSGCRALCRVVDILTEDPSQAPAPVATAAGTAIGDCAPIISPASNDCNRRPEESPTISPTAAESVGVSSGENAE